MWLIPTDPFTLSLTLFGIIVYLLYYYGTNSYDFWQKKGVRYLKPKYPFLGNFWQSVLSMKCTYEVQQSVYNYFKNDPFGGVFQFKMPMLFIKDPSLIESVLIKDFTSFYNRLTSPEIKKVPLQAHLLNLEDHEWKVLRSKLTPTFTSGKLKGMHGQLVECADALVNYIAGHVDKAEPIEAREVMAKLTTDVIGSCAFGLNMNALNDPDSEFRKIGRKIFQPSILSRIRSTFRFSPFMLKFTRLINRSQNSTDFFVRILNETMSFREKNNVIRNDFVQLLMELKKQEAEKQKNGMQEDEHFIIDDNVIASNAFVFFAAGFETTASTLSYCLYELALNEDIQEKAYEHVVSVLKKHGGEITYEAIKEMTLIQNIFSETLRIHPPAVELRRKCTKNYVIPGTSVMLPKNVVVTIPIYSLHHDPNYFPEPEKFKPERFDKERENIKKGTYMPFGDGPRICIGKRFAEMEMRVALVKLLLNYKFKLNPQTISPLVYNPRAFLLVPLGGIWIDVEKRN